MQISDNRQHFVYYLTLNRRIVYVGRSVHPQTRWRIAQRKFSSELKLAKVVALTLKEAQELERREIVRLRPMFNKYVASSSTRLGHTNGPAQRAAASAALKGKPKTEAHKKKLWETRASIAGEANPFYGKTHSAETRELLRKAALAQQARRRALNGTIR